MKIRPEIEVFDDPEYCQADSDKKCNRLLIFDYETYNDAAVCQLYLNDDKPAELDGSEINNKWFKCDQCRADFLEVKRKEPISEIEIDGYLYDCASRSVYGNCGKMAAILILNDQERLDFSKRFKEPRDVPVSTHDGLFNHMGQLFAQAMYPANPGHVYIEILIVITG